MSSAYLEQIYFGAAMSVHPGRMVEFCDGVGGGGGGGGGAGAFGEGVSFVTLWYIERGKNFCLLRCGLVVFGCCRQTNSKFPSCQDAFR